MFIHENSSASSPHPAFPARSSRSQRPVPSVGPKSSHQPLEQVPHVAELGVMACPVHLKLSQCRV